ncbi:MAG: phosphatidate cytidylyltransferase [Zoogloeaceae bacterium]|jgi:phosphatidate cytidylyltransferase|nr:phosphatidate cytidylyltransferase [Zoogloeaceae bacterium]
MLKQRIHTTITLLLILLLAIFSDWTGIVVLLMAAVAACEWGGLAGLEPRGRIAFGGFLFFLCLGVKVFLSYQWLTEVWLPLGIMAAPFWFLIAPIWLLRWRLNRTAWGQALLLFLGVYLIFSAWAAFVYLQLIGKGFLLWVLGIAWVTDGSAWFAERRFGGKKLAPELHSSRTWTGVRWALAGTLLYGLVSMGFLMRFYPSVGWLAGAFAFFLPPLLLVPGMLGNLFESFVKCQAGVKNSSRFLPGHGGLLDRISSLMAILPCCAFYTIFFMLFGD